MSISSLSMSLRRASINSKGFGYAIFLGFKIMMQTYACWHPWSIDTGIDTGIFFSKSLKFVKFNYTHGNPSTAALRWNYSFDLFTNSLVIVYNLFS